MTQIPEKSMIFFQGWWNNITSDRLNKFTWQMSLHWKVIRQVFEILDVIRNVHEPCATKECVTLKRQHYVIHDECDVTSIS